MIDLFSCKTEYLWLFVYTNIGSMSDKVQPRHFTVIVPEMEETNEVSLVEALHKKYSDDEPLEFIVCVPKGAPGKSDSGDLTVPTCLALNNADITCAGDERQIQKLCKRVCELDLTDNNISDFKEVLKLLENMPCVSFLNLTANPLRESYTGEKEKSVYPKVTQLVLNKINFPIHVVCAIMDLFPNLSEIHLSLNGLSKVDIPQQKQYSNIVKIYLNDNNISDWEDINRIGRLFPNLEQLVMIKNPVCAISDTHIQEAACIFSKLYSLNISDTKFHSWSDLEQLRRLKALTELRMRGTPLWQTSDEKICRQLAIGYLPHIFSLNGSPISDGEREDAERAFIRFYMDSEEKPHRYSELEQIHGKIDPLVNVNFSLDDNVSVLVTFKEVASVMTVNVKWTLAELKKQLVKNIPGLPPSKFNVFHHDVGGAHGYERLRYPNLALHVYKIKEGDGLYLDLKY